MKMLMTIHILMTFMKICNAGHLPANLFSYSRFSQILEIRKSDKTIIQDRTIYEDAYIFAPNLHSMGLMSTRDFDNYSLLFKMMSSLVKPPDLLLYLRASVPTLVNQIQKRGREYESSIRIDYLKG